MAFRMTTDSDDNNQWNVSSIDEFIQYCCPDCDVKEKNKEEFIRHALSKHPLSANYLGQIIIKEELFEDIDELKHEEIECDDAFITNDYNIAPDPPEIGINNIDFSESISQVVHEGKKKWRCIICFDTFMIKQSAKQHILSVHQKGAKEVKPSQSSVWKESPASTNKMYKCERCDKPFSQSYFLKHHIRIQECKNQGNKKEVNKVHEVAIKNEEVSSSTSKKYKCDSCDKTFNNSYIFRLHLKTVHETQQKLYNCDFCDLSYRSRPCLIVHRNKVHKNEIKLKPKIITESKRENVVYNCELCGKTFNRNVLKQHKCGTAILPPICHLCGNSFKKKRNLEQHIHTVHEGKKDFKCETCGKDFALMGTLNQHIKLVSAISFLFYLPIEDDIF